MYLNKIDLLLDKITDDFYATITKTQILKNILYETNFVNDAFEKENFDVYNFNFQHMLKSNNIKVIFIKTTRIGIIDFFTFDEYEKNIYYDYSNEDVSNNQSIKDNGHFSQKGHILMAENLYNHIKKLKLNE